MNKIINELANEKILINSLYGSMRSEGIEYIITKRKELKEKLSRNIKRVNKINEIFDTKYRNGADC